MKHSVDLITMGCSKNLVDSERLLQLFAEHGYETFHDPEETHGDIAIINTCGFINDAKEESIEMILQLCDLKEAGKLKGVYVMGCLSERYRQELTEEIPLVDKFYGKFDWKQLVKDLPAVEGGKLHRGRLLTTPKHFAYLKISEGCDRTCAYCAIPLITGKHQSRTIEDILAEVEECVQNGVKEFQVIAQELTYYGVDLYKEQRLPELIERMAKIPGVEWIRLHYAYPNHFPLDLLRVIRENDNVCNYLDIALQHISDNVLNNMRRNVGKEETIALLKKIREEVPGICLRTTLLVGFPNETEEDFEQLLDFVKEMRFDRMGAFTYSEEEGTYAAKHFENNVPEEVKQERLDRLMELQESISTELCAEKVGKTFKTIIDRIEGDYYIGRTEYDSPEVDCEVLIPVSEGELAIGDFCMAHVTSSEEYDLYATLVN